MTVLLAGRLWNTLIRSNPAFKLAASEYISQDCDQTPEEVTAAIQVLKDHHNQRAEQHGEAPTSAYLFETLCRNLEVRESAAVVEEEYTRLFFSRPPEFLFTNTQGLLQQLSERLPLHLISNTMMIRSESLLQLLNQHLNVGQWFSSTTFSDSAGFSKPHPQIFDDSFANIGCEKSEVVHVGDNPITDYQGALVFGFQACLLADDQPANQKSVPSLQEFCDRCRPID